jgi:hypothetical protein
MKSNATVLIFTRFTGCATLLMKGQEPMAIVSIPRTAAFWSNFGLAAGLLSAFGLPDEINEALEWIR